MRRSYLAVLCFLSAVFTLLFLMENNVQAYPTYSQARDDTNCRACHGNFRASPYISLTDGANWGDDNHDVHRRQMLNSDCNTCHGGSNFPVELNFSTGGDGLDPVSCMGCHGRALDDSTANGGACAIDDCSPGAGLQQHHFNAGVTICLDCHDSADPANYLPVGEDFPPPYYFTPDANHPDKPSDPCADDFIGGPDGLDNDGDGDYDGADSDCGPPGCTSDAECDNGEFCDGAETCNTGTGECLTGTPPAVDDGVGCTDDSCDEVNDVVVNTPNDGLCDNGAYCDGAETCDAVNDCQPGTPVNVDDGVGCTDDSCDEVGDVVVNAPNDGLCDNGQFCDGAETCDAVDDCQEGTPPVIDDRVDCTEDICDEVNDVVVNIPDDGFCDNGLFCDGVETCNEASDCQVGTPPCDPATETCDETGDVCEPLGCQSDAECDNGEFCDGAETCDQATGQCLPGTPVNVDDGVGCTDDSCDEVNDVVVNAPNDGLCDNGLFCDGVETCNEASDCQVGTPPCDPATETCDEVGDVCEPLGCQSDAECDNGEFCDGTETCNTGTGECLTGTPPAVDDGVGCTDDSCDEVNDVVVNAPNDGLCDDGAFCNGAETCNAVNDCQAGTPPCDPATETCDEVGDVCEPLGCQSDAECDNGEFCDGTETCDQATGQCLPGTPVNVDDGVGCTDDSCDEVNDVVVNAPNDGFCDNGEFCDGAETCDAVIDCQAGTPPCDPATETCDEAKEICVEPIFIDLDIAKFSAPKSVRLAKVKPVEIKLVVKNSGDFNSQTREATVTGMQNGLKVYEETQNVSDDLGNGRSTFKFGPYTPTATGDILWSATIADDDPDDDTATAVTTVK